MNHQLFQSFKLHQLPTMQTTIADVRCFFIHILIMLMCMSVHDCPTKLKDMEIFNLTEKESK